MQQRLYTPCHDSLSENQVACIIRCLCITCRAAKAAKDWSLPRFWVSIRSYQKQPVKKIWGRILDLAWLKFAVAALTYAALKMLG